MNLKIGNRVIDVLNIKRVSKTQDQMGVVIEYRTRFAELYAPYEIFKEMYPKEMKVVADCLLECIEAAMRQENSEKEPEFYIQLLTEIFIEPRDDAPDYLNIKAMNQHEILKAVAERRIQQYPTLNAAAASLGIVTRTLQAHANWQESKEVES